MNRLKYDEFVPLSKDLEPGEQMQVHHCKLGHNNDRMYIRRTEDGSTILAYCHHCGLSGWYRTRSVPSYTSTTRRHGGKKSSTKGDPDYIGGTQPQCTDVRLPYDFTGDTTEWPREGRIWCYKARISNEQIRDFGIGYSNRHKRVILPCYLDGKLQGYQERRIFEDDPYPKYLTKKLDKDLFWVYNKGRDELTIVEDILSGIRVGKYTDSLALLGTSISDNMLIYILNNNYSKINIWLDNDNYIVNKNRLDIYNKLSLYNNNVNIIDIKNDPKNISDLDIEDIIC